MANGGELENLPGPNVEASAPELGSPSSNGTGDSEVAFAESETDIPPTGDFEMDAEAATTEGTEDTAVEGTRDAFEEVDFGREFQDYLDPGYKTQEFEYKEDAPTFEQFLTRPPSLSEHLTWQLHLTPADDRTADIAESVI